MCKITHWEWGAFWKHYFSPKLGQYNEQNNNNEIKETVVAEAHQMFQLMENTYSQGMTAQRVAVNDLEEDRVYLIVGFILDGKNLQTDGNSKGIYLQNAALQSYENMEHQKFTLSEGSREIFNLSWTVHI